MKHYRTRLVAATIATTLLLAAPAFASGKKQGDTMPPDRPQGLAGEVINDRRISLSWLPTTDNVGVAGYLLFNRGELIADVPGLTFEHYRLLPATLYRYTIKAYDAAGNVSFSEPAVEIDTGDTTAPLPPLAMSFIQRGEDEVRVQWDVAQDNVNVTSYRLFEDSGTGLEVDRTQTNYIHTGLEPSTTYQYRVVSFDAVGNESESSEVYSYTTPDLTNPTEPTDLQAEVPDDSRVLLTWSAADDNVGVDRYRILDTGTLVGEVEGTKFLHEGLLPNSTHQYKVRAVDAADNESAAEPAVLINTGDTTPPSVPGGFSAQVLDDGTIHLSWNASTDNVGVAGYNLLESGNTLQDDNELSFTHGGLNPVTTYSYSLSAFDDEGNESEATGELQVFTGDTTPPTMPGAFTLTMVDDTSIELSWLASTDNVAVTGYEVLADGQVLDPGNNTSVVVGGLVPDETVSYSVRAVDGLGNLSPETAPLTASPTDDTTVALLSEPFLPVIASLNIADRSGTELELSTDELDQIASQYDAMWLQSLSLLPQTQMDYLRAANPDFLVLSYLNSSHSRSSVDDLTVAEAQRLSMINVYLEGFLNAAASPTDLTLDVRPADTERGWGLIPSTIAGVLTLSAQDYVTYLRIGDELMRIEGVNEGAGTVTVTRGFQGTVPTAHSVDAPVLAPVYTGPGGDGGIGAAIPGNSGDLLPAYSLQVGTLEAGQHFASLVQDMLQSGPDGAWLDICSPQFFNQLSALGQPVVPWNLETGAEFTDSQRRLHHDRKLRRIQQIVLSATGQHPVLTANNNSNGKYFPEGGRAMDFVMSTPSKPTPIEAVVLEAVFSKAPDSNFFGLNRWKNNLSTITHGGQNGLPILPWIKSATNDYRPDTAELDRYELYDYAGILLGWEMDNAGFVSLPLFAEDGSGRRLNLSDWAYFDMGQPVDQVAYDAIELLQVAGTNTYLRRWSNGIVLVNPTDDSDASVPLPGQYILPATGQKISSITVPEHTAFLLMNDTSQNTPGNLRRPKR